MAADAIPPAGKNGKGDAADLLHLDGIPVGGLNSLQFSSCRRESAGPACVGSCVTAMMSIFDIS